ncbi:hypothetical protein [Falsirhodobacter xinxiangensis]|uniref:hypothetical protein n=1 Tax=Falsirhodobacter xinxiangensis TaxID=2530049 RepID=UPI0010A9FC7C|nr:hypothetical protein [Rhodobacter xinxiangensis]
MAVTEDDRTAVIVAQSQMIEDIRVSGDEEKLIAYLDTHIGWLYGIDLTTINTTDQLDAISDPLFCALMAARG